MSMTISEARAEIASLYTKAAAIENKYPDGLTQDNNAEDFAEAKRLLGEIDGLEAKLSGLEDADQRKRRILDNQKAYNRPAQAHQQPEGGLPEGGYRPGFTKDFARQFVDNDVYQGLVKSGRLPGSSEIHNFRVDLDGSLLDYLMRKTLAYSASGVGGPLIQNDRTSPVDLLFRQLTFLDLIPTARTTSNMIEYYEMTTSTNNAAFVAEATATTGTTGTKPEGAVGWTLRNSPVSTLAEWIPVTNQFLADAPAVEGLIREQLLIHLNLALETGIISGNGTPPNLTGLLNTANVQTLGLAAGATAGGQATTVDAAYAAMNQVMVTGLASPNAFVMHPNDFMAVRLSRQNAATGTLGDYLYGPPSQNGPQTLWGRPVVLSLGLTENTMLVGDFQRGCMLFDREQAQIRVGLINDQLVRNMQTILAELRAAFVVFRPTAFAKITGV